MKVQYLECKIQNRVCTSHTENTNFHVVLYALILGVSIIGVCNNSINTYIFFTAKNMNSAFFRYLKLYSLNSLLVNLNDMVVLILFFSQVQTLYIKDGLDYYDTVDFVYYYTNIYIVIWALIYSFGGFLGNYEHK